MKNQAFPLKVLAWVGSTIIGCLFLTLSRAAFRYYAKFNPGYFLDMLFLFLICLTAKGLCKLIDEKYGIEDYAEDESEANKAPEEQIFCRKCGSVVDPTTGKCTGCGKKYFEGLKKSDMVVIAVVVGFTVLFLIFGIIYSMK